MNDFVALLLSVAAFCLAFAALGMGVRLAVALEMAPDGLAQGSFAQFALAGLAAHRAWRHLRPKGSNDPRYS